ncbi:membrane fusion protein, multidrug efflux system [Salinihabitans flavidus]|uniref:Membrane fusion protein, multidrug efflux system n=1 Tax=Salinihabitans flavidus TaxID=569882 RepID=A0A1H8NGE4_9RHOB|nr:efflux RND transporter periplasmic adaptor subunit [Salinihabitans flavidus]SEO28684.1 membrane fusion protein, multidrug efflux system [Salinihabitans flavidus]
MRLVPVLTAIVVVAFLYMIVVERDRLIEFAGGGAAESAATQPQDESVAPDTAVPSDKGAVGVIAVKSRSQVTDSAVILRGQTEALRQVDVMAETSGKVVSDPLRKGSVVEEGDVLCKLDPGTRRISLDEAEARLAEVQAQKGEVEARIPEAEARVEEARARLEEARINANAAQKLSESGFASQTRVANTNAAKRSAEAGLVSAQASLKAARAGMESLQANKQAAEAAVARAQTDIDRLTIRAPFAGLLESDTAELGSLMQPKGGSAHCATIIQLDPIKLVGFVPETQVNRVHVGAMAGARLAAGEQDVRGRVIFLSRSADPQTRTFRVEVEVANPDMAIRDGQTAEIMIASDGKNAHLVPQSALTLNDEGTLGVRIVDSESRATFVAVDLMRDTVDGAWVTGLPEEADVIVVGQDYVTEGVPVAPRFQEPGK